MLLWQTLLKVTQIHGYLCGQMIEVMCDDAETDITS